ncbi:MAG: DUF6351 family protein [Oceanococcus sp.]
MLYTGRAIALVALLSSAMLLGCGQGGRDAARATNAGTNGSGSSAAPIIEILSNRADMISGGDVLVSLRAAEGKSLAELNVSLNGDNISDSFHSGPEGQMMARIDSLQLGDNTLIASSTSGQTQTIIRNYPNEGPIFSRPEIKRLRCQDSATDINCNQPAEYTYLYRPTALTDNLEAQPVAELGTGLLPYDPANPPADVAMTTTQNGQSVPFIVRQERGYQDRDEYKILTLFNPDEAWQPWSPQPQWNGKMLITHGGNCGAKYTPGSAPLDDYSGTFGDLPLLEPSYIYALGQGYAVLSTALANTGHNCDVALAAESIMMAKERFVEQYGPLRYTIGTGCSGGSIAQLTIANAYPGLYQGLLTMCAYPDSLSAGLQFADLHLMRKYFEAPETWAPGVVWNPALWGPVEGHLTHVNAVVADTGLFQDATRTTGTCFGDNSYDPQTNPTGQRCGILEWIPHILGQRSPDVWSDVEKQIGYGFTGIPLGNTGVQYGLETLRSGLITPAMFIDLNLKIGGLNVDMLPQAARTQADHPAVGNAYRSGMINATNNLDTVPILTFVGPDPGIAHDSLHAWWIRWRIEREHGSARNHVMWGGPAPLLGDLSYVYKGLDAMDEWLANVEADTTDTPLPDKISRNRPGDLQDQCAVLGGEPVLGEVCIDLLRPLYAYGTPRTVAGDTATADNFDCQLKPLDRNDDYGLVPFTDEQWQQLETLFSNGVCDYRAPGQGKQKTVSWLGYVDDSGRMIVGGEPLPAAPALSGTGTQSAAFAYPVRDR